ncbi:MAG TPA: hypothetical protein VF323_03375 [Candidatus Limnocylindrales bacterium]
MSDDSNPVLDGLDKLEETGKGAYERGERYGQETGITPGWANAAHDVDPELAKSAADDWDKGDHAKAVGKFVYATGESIYEGVGDFVSGVTGQVEATVPTIDIESHEDVEMRSSSVAHDDPPPPPPSDE